MNSRMENLTQKLDDLEARLQTLIEERLAGLLPARLNKEELLQRLMAAMKSSLAAQNESPYQMPAVFRIHLHPDDHQQLAGETHFTADLARGLQRAAGQEGLPFEIPPALELIPDTALAPGEIRVTAQLDDALPEETHALEIEFEEDASPPPANAFLIVNGSQIFNLEHRVVNIGRRSDNDLVIGDPRVSRYHAQLRAQGDSYHIFDLESTGGTFINGERVLHRALQPGDVISLAGIPLVYAQDEPMPNSPTQKLPPSPGPEDEKPTRGQGAVL